MVDSHEYKILWGTKSTAANTGHPNQVPVPVHMCTRDVITPPLLWPQSSAGLHTESKASVQYWPITPLILFSYSSWDSSIRNQCSNESSFIGQFRSLPYETVNSLTLETVKNNKQLVEVWRQYEGWSKIPMQQVQGRARWFSGESQLRVQTDHVIWASTGRFFLLSYSCE